MIQIAIGGIIAVILGVIIRKTSDDIALFISIGTCILILLWGLSKLEVIVSTINQIQGFIQIDKAYIGILFKIIGITYISEISASLCKDAGYGAIGEQIEFVAKLTILAISMPILMALLETISSFLTVK